MVVVGISVVFKTMGLDETTKRLHVVRKKVQALSTRGMQQLETRKREQNNQRRLRNNRETWRKPRRTGSQVKKVVFQGRGNAHRCHLSCQSRKMRIKNLFPEFSSVRLPVTLIRTDILKTEHVGVI